MSTLSEEAFWAGLLPLTQRLEHEGFAFMTVDDQPCYFRSEPYTEAQVEAGFIPRQEKVVLWRHPRLPHEVQGHVASSMTPHKVHLRFFDPDWRPEKILPSYLGKGFAFSDEASLRAVATRLAEVIWPRAMAWFEDPVEAEALLVEEEP